MSEIIESYQETKALEAPQVSMFAYATIISEEGKGVKVKFDGEGNPSTKTFPKNTSVKFTPGQRVLMQKVNGQYICAFPVT